MIDENKGHAYYELIMLLYDLGAIDEAYHFYCDEETYE